MHCGFEGITKALPANRSRVEDLVLEAGLGEDVVEQLLANGLEEVPVLGDTPLFKLVAEALSQLAEGVSNLVQRTYGIIFAHSLPVIDSGEMSFLAACTEGFGLDRVPGFTISGQPCSILHWGVQLAQAWLSEAPPGQGIILLGGDKAYNANGRIFFNSAMGDAAVAGFISREASGHTIISSVSDTVLYACNGELSDEDDIKIFRQHNPSLIRAVVERCVQAGGVTLDRVKYIVPHTPYHAIWDAMSTLLRFPRDRFLTCYMMETGHFNSNDSFCHYVRAVEEGMIRQGDLVLLVNPGFGGTRGCTLIRR